MSPVEEWVKKMTEDELGQAPFKIGDVVLHPDGRKVKITGGQYWGDFGLSNHWFWKEIRRDGSLGPEEHGYGWRPKE